MSYQKLVRKDEPALIQFILDDSISMGDPMPGAKDPKYLWVERYFGLIVQWLLNLCTARDNATSIIVPRYYLNVIIFGSHPRIWIREILSIDEAIEEFAKAGNSLGLGGKVSGTDAKAAFEMAADVLARAVVDERFRKSFPPMSLHLTDGESQTDASDEVRKIQQLSTDDGAPLVVNAYIGTQTNLKYAGPEDFPGYQNIKEAGPAPDCVRMFNMSSEVPPTIYANLKADGIFPSLRPDVRLFFDVRTKEMLRHVIQVVGSVGSRAAR